MNDLVEAGYVSLELPLDLRWDFVKSWKWFLENSQISSKQTFTVLVDLGTCAIRKSC